MRIVRQFFITAFFVSTVFFLSSPAARAQGAVTYGFLETVDYADKPVANATVKVEASCGGGEFLTDEKGRMEKFPIGLGDCRTHDFTISKSGYYPIRDIALFRFHYFNNLLNEQSRSDRSYPPRELKFELLIIPKNRAERKAVGKEQSKRELFWAIADKNHARVEKLLQSGVKPDITTDDLRGFPGRQRLPAFIFAASLGGIETVKPFLKAGINLRRENSPARDVLLYYLSNYPFSYRDYVPENEEDRALLAHYQDGADILINAGASLKATTKTGKTALMIAAENGDARTVKTLLAKHLPVNQPDSAGRVALIYATHFNGSQTPGKLEIARLLLENGANLNLLAPDLYGGCTSALMNAAAGDNLVLLKLLLNNKADVNLTCGDGRNALRAALKFESYTATPERYEIIKTLIDAGADVNFAGVDGETNLMFAVNAGTPETIEILIKNGALINTRDKKGETALMKASYYKTGIVKILLERGADPNIAANSIDSKVDGKADADCETALTHAAASSDGAQIIELLIRHGAKVNFACANGETALTKAARSAQPQTVKKLLEVGADARGEQGRLALRHAREMLRQYEWSKEKSEQIINLLEAAGAK